MNVSDNGDQNYADLNFPKSPDRSTYSDGQQHPTYGSMGPNFFEDEEGQQTVPSITSDFNRDESIGMILRLACAHVISYLIVAVVAYSYWLEPTWTCIDSLYFATNLFTTVGQGDKEPSTPTGQLFTVFMSVYGVAVLGVFLGVLGHFVSEKQLAVVQKIKSRSRNTVLTTLMETAEEQQKQQQQKRTNISNKQQISPLKSQPPKVPASYIATWGTDFRALCHDVWVVIKTEFPEIALVIVLAFVLGMREGWSIISTLYFCIMSASTTGFGDFVPKTQVDKLYCVFFLPLSVAVLGEVLGRIATVYLQRQTRQKEAEFLQRTITLCDLRRMDANNDDNVDMEEFLTFMLVALQKVDPQDLEDLKTTFHALDANGNGYLDRNDLAKLAETAQKRNSA